MPDTVLYNQVGTTPIATDEVSGVQYQVIKWDIGAPDTSIPLSGSAAFGIPVFTNKGITLVGPVGVSGSVSVLALPGISIIGPATVSGTVSIGAAVGIPIIGPAAVSGTITALGPSASGSVFSDGLFPKGVLGSDGIVWPAKGDNLAQYVQGPVASGIAFTGNPLVFAGVDVAGLTHTLLAPLGRLTIQGPVAANASLLGINPVNIGGIDSSNNSIALQMTSPADGSSNSVNTLRVLNYNLALNGAATPTWDRIRTANGASGTTGIGIAAAGPMLHDGNRYWAQRGNTDETALASAVRTATASAAMVNYNGKGIIVTLNITVSSSGTLTLTIANKDGTSGQFSNVLTSAALTGAQTKTFIVHPSIPGTLNLTAQTILSRDYKIQVTPSDGQPYTYSCGVATSV